MRQKQITASQRQRAEETIDIMETWADGANRRDKSEEDWDALRAEVENPNLRDFEKLLEKEVAPTHPYTFTATHTSPSHTHTLTFAITLASAPAYPLVQMDGDDKYKMFKLKILTLLTGRRL